MMHGTNRLRQTGRTLTALLLLVAIGLVPVYSAATWPTAATKTHLDAATDDPKQARGELATLVDKFNELLGHVSSFMQTHLAAPDAATARTNLALGTAATKNIGTSGDAVPLLDQGADFSSEFRLSGTVSPAQLTADVHNYSPTGTTSPTCTRCSTRFARRWWSSD